MIIRSSLKLSFFLQRTLAFGLVSMAFGAALVPEGRAQDTESATHRHPLVSDSQLLLPRSYQQHFTSLHEAANLALQTDRCERLLQGGLQLDRSTPDHPIFRILCRDQYQQSFAMLIDGRSLHLLDDTRPGGSISFADWRDELEAEKERQRVLEELEAAALSRQAEERRDTEMFRVAQEAIALEAARRARLWAFCSQQLKSRVRNMRELVWLTESMPEAHVDEGNRFAFYLDFNAEDLYRQPLHYRAECRIQSEEDFKLTIRPRKSMVADQFEGQYLPELE